MEYCEFENRIMSDDPASVADDQEIGRGDAASVTNDEEIGMSYGMRGDIVLDSALNMLNLILPWQQTKEQPKEEKDEIILEAASLGDTSTTADARRIRDTSRVGERAGPIQKASRPPSGAMFLQSTAPSAPAPSVDETQDRAATTRAPETPPQVSGGGALTTSRNVGISNAAPVQHYNI